MILLGNSQRGSRPKVNIADVRAQYHIFDELGAPPEYLDYNSTYIHYFNHLLSLVYKIIIIDGLPKTCDETFFKYAVFLKGKCVFFKDDSGNLLSLWGTYNDQPDVYYIPEYMQIDNPTFNKSYFLKRGVDCEVVYCRDLDRYTGDLHGGLYSLINLTASLLADNAISLSVAQKNTRLSVMIGSDDTATTQSIETSMRRMYRGEPFTVAQTSLIGTLQGIPLTPSAGNRYITDLISAEQYIYAKFFEQIGISTHDQIKKERLVTGEINDNIDLSIFNINNITSSISEGFERVNKRFGTDISLSINPIILEQMQAAADQSDDSSEPETEPDDTAADDDPPPAEEPEAEAEPEPEAEPEAPAVKVDVSVNVGDDQSDDNSEPETEPEAEAEPEPEAEPEAPAVEVDVSVSVGDDQNDDSSEPETEPDDQDDSSDQDDSED